jgi:hypothetical protein
MAETTSVTHKFEKQSEHKVWTITSAKTHNTNTYANATTKTNTNTNATTTSIDTNTTTNTNANINANISCSFGLFGPSGVELDKLFLLGISGVCLIYQMVVHAEHLEFIAQASHPLGRLGCSVESITLLR